MFFFFYSYFHSSYSYSHSSYSTYYYYELIESDRKINIDILEANKAANREDIRRLREESKELRAKLAQLQRVSSNYLY